MRIGNGRRSFRMVMLAFVVGLLGTGAQALAEDGVSWESILSAKTWQVKNTSDMGSSIEWPATARVTFKPNGVLVLHNGYPPSSGDAGQQAWPRSARRFRAKRKVVYEL